MSCFFLNLNLLFYERNHASMTREMLAAVIASADNELVRNTATQVNFLIEPTVEDLCEPAKTFPRLHYL